MQLIFLNTNLCINTWLGWSLVKTKAWAKYRTHHYIIVKSRKYIVCLLCFFLYISCDEAETVKKGEETKRKCVKNIFFDMRAFRTNLGDSSPFSLANNNQVNMMIWWFTLVGMFRVNCSTGFLSGWSALWQCTHNTRKIRKPDNRFLCKSQGNNQLFASFSTDIAFLQSHLVHNFYLRKKKLITFVPTSSSGFSWPRLVANSTWWYENGRVKRELYFIRENWEKFFNRIAVLLGKCSFFGRVCRCVQRPKRDKVFFSLSTRWELDLQGLSFH